MSARSRGTNDDLNLSLTGSAALSSVRKSSSAKQLHRPNSVSDMRTGKGVSSLNKLVLYRYTTNVDSSINFTYIIEI